jgi:hypothetical protein
VLDALANPDLWPTVANAIVAVYGTVTLIAGRRALKTAHKVHAAALASSHVQSSPSVGQPASSHVQPRPEVTSRHVTSASKSVCKVVSITYAAAEFVEQLKDRGGGEYESQWLIAEFELYSRKRGWRTWGDNVILAEIANTSGVEKYRAPKRADGRKPFMYQIQGRNIPEAVARPYALPAGVPDTIEKPRRRRA